MLDSKKTTLSIIELRTPVFILMLRLFDDRAHTDKKSCGVKERSICFFIDRPLDTVRTSLRYCLDNGLLFKRVDCKDARLFVYSLTPKGVRVLAAFYKYVSEFESK